MTKTRTELKNIIKNISIFKKTKTYLKVLKGIKLERK